MLRRKSDRSSVLRHCIRQRCVWRVAAELRDACAPAKIAIRIDRVATGNFGDCKVLRDGVCGLRIDGRAVYRVYYAMLGQTCVLLLAGGNKRKQSSDIEQELGYLKDYRKRTKKYETKSQHLARRSSDGPTSRNPDFAVQYLKAALEEGSEPRVLLIALHRVVQARGIAEIAKTEGVERGSPNRALSTRGNPRLSTLAAVAKAVGLRLTVEAAR